MSVPCREDIIECFDDSTVGGNTTNKVNWFRKDSFLERGDHPSNTFTECVKHGFNRDAFLLQVNKVALGKDAAPGGNPGWFVLTLERQVGEVIQADAESVGLLLNESSRAGLRN